MDVVVATPAELDQLLDIISNHNAPLQSVESNFRAAFGEDQYAKVILALQFLRRDAGMIVGNSSHIEAVNALLILDAIRRGGGGGGECAQIAKAAMFDVLYHLEVTLREDARKSESSKYRATTKEGAQQTKRACKDVTDAEFMRGRTAVKLFGLQLLAGKADLSQSATAVSSQDQATVDAQLDHWQKNSIEVKEAMGDILHASESESEKNSVGILSRLGSIGYVPVHGTAQTQYVQPFTTRATLPQAQSSVNELHFLMNTSSLAQQLIFDGQWHSAEWRTAKELITVASSTKLTSQQLADAMSSFTSTTVPRLGVTPSLICAVTAHNPEVAAALLNKLKDPSALLEAIFVSSAAADHVETVLLHCVKSLKQIHVYKYVAASISRVRGAESGSSTQKELLVNLATTLHQLIIKFGKDNKELYLNDNQKGELGRLFDEYASNVFEVTSRWADLK